MPTGLQARIPIARWRSKTKPRRWWLRSLFALSSPRRLWRAAADGCPALHVNSVLHNAVSECFLALFPWLCITSAALTLLCDRSRSLRAKLEPKAASPKTDSTWHQAASIGTHLQQVIEIVKLLDASYEPSTSVLQLFSIKAPFLQFRMKVMAAICCNAKCSTEAHQKALSWLFPQIANSVTSKANCEPPA